MYCSFSGFDGPGFDGPASVGPGLDGPGFDGLVSVGLGFDSGDARSTYGQTLCSGELIPWLWGV
jgi:hypothetical protein